MQDRVQQILADAAAQRKPVRIIYRGGTQPGRVREIVPISVSEREIRAKDVAAGIEKTFILSRIDLAESQTQAKEYDPSAGRQIEDFQTIHEAFISRVNDFQALGWHVELSKDKLALHAFFKNGKPRKTPDVLLTYDEFTTDFIVDIDSGNLIEEKRRSTRPYRLEVRGAPSARSFQKLSNAITEFLANVKEQRKAG